MGDNERNYNCTRRATKKRSVEVSYGGILHPTNSAGAKASDCNSRKNESEILMRGYSIQVTKKKGAQFAGGKSVGVTCKRLLKTYPY